MRIIITHSSVKINIKLIRCVATILIILLIIEGFRGEFSNPTVFDIVKWICCIILVGCLFFQRKSEIRRKIK